MAPTEISFYPVKVRIATDVLLSVNIILAPGKIHKVHKEINIPFLGGQVMLSKFVGVQK